MTPYIINAWLDCSSPHITINDSKTGELLVHYNENDVVHLFHQGEISLDEVQSTDAAIQENLVVSLLLFKSTRIIEQQLENAYLDLKQRAPTPLAEFNKPTFQQALQKLVSFPTASLQHTG